MSSLPVTEIEEKARHIREQILKMTNHAGCGHVGGSLSEADILAVLYWEILNINPNTPKMAERDRFILSKGHATPGYYATLALRGYFPLQELLTFDKAGSSLQGHPDMHKTPGVDFSSGSLGQGLSIGLGFALGRAAKGSDFTSYVLLGDGELQEGQIWETALYIGSRKVTHIVPIIDYNKVQLSGTTEEILNLEPLAEKWAAFGFHPLECDGHNIEDLVATLQQAKNRCQTEPVVVIAHTIKGKGVSFMEGQYKWHGLAPNDQELHSALRELSLKESVEGVDETR